MHFALLVAYSPSPLTHTAQARVVSRAGHLLVCHTISPPSAYAILASLPFVSLGEERLCDEPKEGPRCSPFFSPSYFYIHRSLTSQLGYHQLYQTQTQSLIVCLYLSR